MMTILHQKQFKPTSSKQVILLLVSTLPVMVATTIAPALPEMEIYFNSTPNVKFLVRLAVTLPALFLALVSPFIGVIIDKWGRKRLLFSATTLYGITGTSALFLNSIELILIGRALLGIATAGLMITSTTLIADYYQGNHRTKVMGNQGVFMALGGILFLVLGGFLANIYWQYVFLVYLGAFLLLPGIWILLYEPDVVQLNEQKSNEIVGLPYIIIGKAVISIFLLQVFFYISITEIPFYLTNSLLLDPNQVGLVLAMITVSMGVSALFYRKIKNSINFGYTFSIGFLLFSVGYLMLSIFPTVEGVVISLFVIGLGLGLLLPNFTVWLTSVTPNVLRGRVLSIYISFLFLGQFTSPIVSQTLLRTISISELFLIASFVLASLASFFLIDTFRQNRN